jgi:hypothetical protein
MSRGRPKIHFENDAPPPRQFERIFVNDDGTIDVWKYDLDIWENGPIETVVIGETKAIISDKKGNKQHEIDETDESIPRSKRKYLNPANGKLVGYTRAYNLGLI